MKKVYEAVFMDLTVRQPSGRQYVIEDVVKALPNFVDRVHKGTVYCEYTVRGLHHDGDIMRSLTVDLDNTIARIKSCRYESGKIIGTYVPCGPYGDLLRKILETGDEPKFAFRGVTELFEKDGISHAKVHAIVTFDICAIEVSKTKPNAKHGLNLLQHHIELEFGEDSVKRHDSDEKSYLDIRYAGKRVTVQHSNRHGFGMFMFNPDQISPETAPDQLAQTVFTAMERLKEIFREV